MSGQRVLKQLGITGLPITNVENACSSSSSAFRQATYPWQWSLRRGLGDGR